MAGSAVLAVFALQLLGALEGPVLGSGDPAPRSGSAGPAFGAEPARSPERARASSWLTVRREEGRASALAAAGPPDPPQ